MGSLNTGHGVIATLVRGDEVAVRHFDVTRANYSGRKLVAGSGTNAAVVDLIRYCDAGGWRVRSISTPSTILRDLEGIREGRDTFDRAYPQTNPETQLLHRRLDLLEERATRETTVAAWHLSPHRRRRRS